MNCKDCVYCWEDEYDDYPYCHFEVRTCWDIPPCEEENNECIM